MSERNMSFFMNGKAEAAKEEEVVVSKRYKDENGKIVKFVMKAIDTERLDQLVDECMEDEFEKGKKVGEKLNRGRYNARVAIESTVYPNLRDPELLKSYGCADPVDAAKKVLSVGGEYANWINQAMRVNGFQEDFNDLAEEAKN